MRNVLLLSYLYFSVVLSMYRANYLQKNFSVCSATRRKIQNPPKDTAIKIQFTRGLQRTPL